MISIEHASGYQSKRYQGTSIKAAMYDIFEQRNRKELVGQKVAPTVGLEPTISPLGGERLIH